MQMTLLVDMKPRLYQEAIFSNASQRNTLVVLPTGLGKTMIAMLMTAHRLATHPDSKILILAPTKPLVQQHEQTFRKHISLPDEKFALFTGEIQPEVRKALWQHATIIFSTPQALENDLLTRNITLENVSLLVVDEAHRATGDYAYVFVTKQYNTYSNFPRILALTASPGSQQEVIDEVIKNLFIEHIEVRTPDDIDVRPYVQDIEIEYVTVPLPEGFIRIKRALDTAYKAKMMELERYGYAPRDIGKAGLLALQSQLHGLLASGEKDFAIMKSISLGAEILKLSHAIELLESQGLEPLRQYLHDLQVQGEQRKSRAAVNLVQDPNFKNAVYLTDKLLEEEGEHPKLEKVRTIMAGLKPGEKAIIFSNYRNTGIKVKQVLDKLGIESRVFVGQMKKGESGMSQKEQKETIAEFRDGLFPVLIATSVGEEGLDIPTVDLVLFYEPVPSGIRTIQRRGRTARHTAGKVVVLISEGTRDVAYRWSSHHKEKRMYRVLLDYRKKLLPRATQTTLPRATATLQADFREKGSGVLKELTEIGVQPLLMNLSVADYVLSDRVAIELKTVEDFVNSIIDGRLLQQLRDLRQYSAPLLIIQGTEDIYSVRNIHPNAIRGMFGAITTGYRIPILWTKNARDTAALIAVLLKREQEEDRATPYEAKPQSDRELQEHIVASLPGIGITLARPLLEHFGSVAAVFAAAKTDLQQVPLIGEKKAASIHDIIHKQYEKQ